jgi:hypothetical protein
LPPKPPPKDSSPGTVAQITTALTALASLVAFVYLLGAAVLWIRLWRKDLPT